MVVGYTQGRIPGSGSMKPNLTVETKTSKSKTGTAKAYLINLAAAYKPSKAPSPEHMQAPERARSALHVQVPKPAPASGQAPAPASPVTPTEQIISSPFATPKSVPDLVPDRGNDTPASSLEKHSHESGSGRSSSSSSSPSSSPSATATTQPSALLSPLKLRRKHVAQRPEAPDCVFCSTDMRVAVSGEPLFQLKCGHFSHKRCLSRLDGSVKELDNSYDVPCLLCDNPAASVENRDEPDITFSSPEEFAPWFRHGISSPESSGASCRGTLRSTPLGAFATASTSRPSLRKSASSLTQTLHTAGSPRRNSNDSSLPTQRMAAAGAEPSSPVSALAFPTAFDSDSSSVSTGRLTLSSMHSRLQNSIGESKSSLSAQISATGQAQSQAPDSPTSSTYPEQESCLGVSARKEIQSLLSSDLAAVVECSPRMHPFHVVTATDQPRKGITRVLLAVQTEQAASDRDALSDYRSSAKDIQHSTRMRKKLAGMQFEFGTIAMADLTALRLHTRPTLITSPDSRTMGWHDAEVYLFDNMLLISRGTAIAAALSLQHNHVHAYVEPSRPTVVELRFDKPDILDINFHASSAAVAYMWKHAFADPKAHFPLAPGERFDKYVSRLETYLEDPASPKLSPFVPADIVLCLPLNSQSQAFHMQQAVRSAISTLSYRDRLGLVLYSRRGIEHRIPLAAPHSETWVSALAAFVNGSASAGSGPGAAAYTLDSVLEAAARVLDHNDELEATASVILVSDGDVTLQRFPRQLARMRVPVHAVGLFESHNALALSMLARHSLGSYHYIKAYTELNELVQQLTRLEATYTHKNVVLRLKPRISTSVVGVWGGQSAPAIETLYSGTAYLPPEPVLSMFEGSGSVLEWRLGKMRMTDIRELVVEVHGDVPAGTNILQVGIEATHVLSPGDTACAATFRIPVPAEPVDPRLHSMLAASDITLSVLSELEKATIYLLLDESRAAYDQFLRGLQRLQSVRGSGFPFSRPFMALLEAYEWLFDMCCDDIVKSSQRTQSFMLDLLQRIWLFYSKMSLLERDQIESVFSSEG